MSDDILSDITMLKTNIVRLLKEREALGDYDVNAHVLRQILGMFLLLTGLVENVVRLDQRERDRLETAEMERPETPVERTGAEGQAAGSKIQAKRGRNPLKH